MLQTQLIYCGDNLQKLRELPDECVDLIYIDPPFNSNRNYEVFWGDAKEKRAFDDRFGAVEHYIHWMRPRVSELYRVLKKTGSFYYHCDWHADSYVRVMLDQQFGFPKFRNQIIWSYRRWPAKANFYQRMHDVIYFYAKSSDGPGTFHVEYEENSPSYTKRFKGKTQMLDPETGTRKITLDEDSKGLPQRDVWDISILAGSSKERLGYPTQKPLPLLNRIIEASSNKGDVVLDAFCGCGTTLVSSQNLGRRWLGIDISPTACRVMAARLTENCLLREGKDFWVRDLPKTAEELRKYPPFEFENWAVNALNTVISNGHAIANKAQVGDMGIDGRIYPATMLKEKKAGYDLFGESDRWFPVQVKQKDKAGRPDIDSFETAMQRQNRDRGFFISFDFTSDAHKEIARAQREMNLFIVPITVAEILNEEVQYRV